MPYSNSLDCSQTLDGMNISLMEFQYRLMPDISCSLMIVLEFLNANGWLEDDSNLL